MSARTLQQFRNVSATEQAHQYHEAVATRKASIAAVDRFYRDLVVYQWRVDALDSQLSALSAASRRPAEIAGESSCQSEDPDVADESDEEMFEWAIELAKRRSLCEHSLAEILKQSQTVVSSFEERASHYAIGERGASGRLERLAASEEERQRALERFRSFVQETQAEMMIEVQEILKVAPGPSGLEDLFAVLSRRRAFWNGQLEETWSAWQEATMTMHQSGEEVVETWGGLAILASNPNCWWCRASGCSHALAVVAARCLEVELLDTLGLSGLCDTSLSTETVLFSTEARLALLVAMLEELRTAEHLHLVGDALHDRVFARGAASHLDPGARCLPGDRKTKAKQECTTSPVSEAWVALKPWLVQIFVEALCEAICAFDVHRAQSFVQLCHIFGGSGLADEVHGSASRVERRRGLTPQVLGGIKLQRSLSEDTFHNACRECRASKGDWLKTIAKRGGYLEVPCRKWIRRAWLGRH